MKSKIKVRLVRHRDAIDDNEYEIASITGAIRVVARLKYWKAGQRVSEGIAEDFALSYEVTVVPAKA